MANTNRNPELSFEQWTAGLKKKSLCILQLEKLSSDQCVFCRYYKTTGLNLAVVCRICKAWWTTATSGGFCMKGRARGDCLPRVCAARTLSPSDPRGWSGRQQLSHTACRCAWERQALQKSFFILIPLWLPGECACHSNSCLFYNCSVLLNKVIHRSVERTESSRSKQS